MEKQCAGFEPICIYCASENVHDCESKRDRCLCCVNSQIEELEGGLETEWCT